MFSLYKQKNQNEEYQMAAQCRLEADDTIQKLKKQKMVCTSIM